MNEDPNARAETQLRADRVEPFTYVGRNGRGAEVQVGLPGEPGTFSPGELLHLALATCAAVSADHALSSQLGEDFQASVGVKAQMDPKGERYSAMSVELRADMGSLEESRHEALIGRALHAVERLCTVGHTVSAGAESGVDITHQPTVTRVRAR